MRLQNIPISRKITLTFGLLVLGFCAMAAIVIYSLARIQDASKQIETSVGAVMRVDEVSKTMLDLSGQVRGFLLTQDEDFAKGVAADYTNVKDELTKLSSALSTPGEHGSLDAIVKAVDGYMSEAGDPEIANGRNSATLDKALEIMRSGANKKWMNAFKAAEKDFQTVEAGLRESAALQRSAAASWSYWSALGGAAAMIALAIALGRLLHSQIATPVDGIEKAMIALADGDLGVEVPGAERRDEVGGMAAAVQVFKTNAIERIRAEDEASRHRAAAEAERERATAEKTEASERLSVAMQALGEGLRRFASGDLTTRLDQGFAAEYARVREDFNAAAERLTEAMRAVVASTNAINSDTREISSASDDLSQRTEQQAASLGETASALEQITATLKKSAEGAKHAADVVANADEHAKNGAVVVGQAVEAMDAIANSSTQIGQIIGVIDEIAFQTNLLALNAGVEAARAGEAGRGFAVVASEVRALAQRSAEAAKEIKSLISTSGTQVDAGVKLVAKTGEALKRIIAEVSEINGIVANIASGSQEQASALQEVNAAINQMDQTTQSNAAMVEESTATSRSLSQETSQLANLVSQFKVGDNGEANLRRELEKAAPHVFAKPAAAKSAAERRTARLI